MRIHSMSKMLFVLAALFIIISSCKKEEIQKELTNHDWWPCHDALDRDEEATRQHLIGVWNWEHKVCPFSPTDVPTTTEHSGLSAEFRADNTLIIRQDGEPILTTNWDIAVSELYTASSASPIYKLQTNTAVNQLYGAILFCENEVLFTSSYVDGCDNRFMK